MGGGRIELIQYLSSSIVEILKTLIYSNDHVTPRSPPLRRLRQGMDVPSSMVEIPLTDTYPNAQVKQERHPDGVCASSTNWWRGPQDR